MLAEHPRAAASCGIPEGSKLATCWEEHKSSSSGAAKTSENLASFHPEMALFRNLGVNLQDRLCGVPSYASAQSLDLTRGLRATPPCGQPCGCPIPLSCGIVLDLTKNSSFVNWKLTLVPVI